MKISNYFINDISILIEKVLLKHLNEKQFNFVCNYLNTNLQKSNLIGDTIFILKDNNNNIIIYKSNPICSTTEIQITHINQNGVSNDFLSKKSTSSNSLKSEEIEWMRKEIINSSLTNSISIIRFEFNDKENWTTKVFGKLTNDLLGLEESILENLYDNVLFSFNNIQIDVFSNWFNHKNSESLSKQVLPILGGNFTLTRPVFTNGGGNKNIHSFDLRKDNLDNLLFFYNDFIIESGEFIKEQFNLIIINKGVGKTKFVKLYKSNDETTIYNESLDNSILLLSYKRE